MNTAKLDEIRQGDPDTMTALLEEVAPVIRFVAARYKVDPDDILQEVTIQLFRDKERTARLAKEGTLRSWCSVVSRNIAMHQLHRTQKEWLSDVSADESTKEVPVGLNPSDPARILENAELLGKLLSMIDQDDQRIILMRYLEELTFDEIASRLDLSPDAVRQKANRAMAKLRYRIRHQR